MVWWSLIRIRLNLGILTPVALTYQLPEWMLIPDGPQMPPITLSCDKVVEIMTNVRDYLNEAVLYVTNLVGGHPIVCSKHMLEIMFNEPQLLIVFRVALEIEMVYAQPNDDGETEDPAAFPHLTVDDIIAMELGFPLSPDDPSNYGPNDEGMESL
ncbi:hypothetical protein F2Q70_00042765 [Brassica cretica]|uniref:Uncharacterized protein n=1 Tax=Brassica cretica TaxID=69181 RepID=A0A8S9KKC4_BRACR|nr:hypothetical protein F2Q70_00042765 [Brassica cretica]